METTQLLNRFWRLDEQLRFTAVETRLYLMLLDIFARVGTDRSVTWTNTLATGLLGVSLNAFRRACYSLMERGLIHVDHQVVKRRHYTTITLAQEEKTKPTPDATPRRDALLHVVPQKSQKPHAVPTQRHRPHPHRKAPQGRKPRRVIPIRAFMRGDRTIIQKAYP